MLHPFSTATPPTKSPIRTVVTSFTPRKPEDGVSVFEEGDWVLCLASSTSSSSSSFPTSAAPTISCALSNGRVQVYDQQSLLPVVSYIPSATTPTENPSIGSSSSIVTDLIYGPQDSLIVTSQDGSVVLTDLRQPMTTTSSMRAMLPTKEAALAIGLGYDGYLAAVASDRARVHFLDLRQPSSMVGCYKDSHTDAVTQVAFHPDVRSLLVSAGEDGLVCVFDTTQSSEELALGSVLNVGSSCRRVGFCGGNDRAVYCLTGSETASVWDFHTTTCLHDFGQFQLRDQLTALNGGVVPIEYLVDAAWDKQHGELHLCAGNSAGNAVVYKSKLLSSAGDNAMDGNGLNVLSTGNGGAHPFASLSSSWQVSDLLMGGHRGVVRAWCPLTTSSTMSQSSLGIMTAGEDARLCEWSCLDRVSHGSSMFVDATAATTAASPALSLMPSSSISPSSSTDNGGPSPTSNSTRGFGGGPIRRQRRRPSKQSAPY